MSLKVTKPNKCKGYKAFIDVTYMFRCNKVKFHKFLFLVKFVFTIYYFSLEFLGSQKSRHSKSKLMFKNRIQGSNQIKPRTL